MACMPLPCGSIGMEIVRSLPADHLRFGCRRRRREMQIQASKQQSPDPGRTTISSSKSRLRKILDLPRSIWKQMVQPLNNFGFGNRSFHEAGVGLFMIGGGILISLMLLWVRGTRFRARSQKYYATFEFAKAWGITVGTPVRIRGVSVGSVVSVRPSLERLDVGVQILDTKLVIPKNALVEVNQSGLVSETLIDITPRLPIPRPTAGPLDAECKKEGLIVCDRDRIKGEQGVSLDELVGICTKLARQVDAQGVHNFYEIGERISSAVEDSKPLLARVQAMAGDLEPLIKEIRQGGLLRELEKLTKVIAEAGEDVRKLNSSILTSENIELLRQSVATLTKTLKHIESISGDVSLLTGDSGTRYNLQQLIQQLSRLLSD